jgi:DNA-binding transcriptional regulator YbjK
MNKQNYSSRAQQAVVAAVEVLGEMGAAGLTHRAVDRHARLPEGSTSNHFRTREALIDAICRFLTVHDLERLELASQQFFSQGEMSVAAAADGIVAIIEDWTTKEASFTAARLELFNIAYRNPRVALQLDEVRRSFREKTIDWLESLAAGAGEHVALVMATVEGLTANQLLHANYRMTNDQIRQELTLFLSTLCAPPSN